MKKATREAFGEVLLELGKENEKIVSLSADLQDSTKAIYFQEKYEDRFFNVGIAEQDLIGVAAGLAGEGFISIVSSFASFLVTRPFDHIRILLCYNNLNVKIVATHSGLTVGEDGGTAQMLEDISLMRVLPNMKVFQPCDANETKAILKEVIKDYGPAYIRLARAEYPIIFSEDKIFEIGKGDILKEGDDLTIISTGYMVSKGLEVIEKIEKKGYSVRFVNMSSIKPIDKELILESAKKTKKIVTIEEHQKIGGLGSAVCEVLAEESDVVIKIIGIKDEFGQSGKPEELIKLYNLDVAELEEEILKFLNK